MSPGNGIQGILWVLFLPLRLHFILLLCEPMALRGVVDSRMAGHAGMVNGAHDVLY